MGGMTTKTLERVATVAQGWYAPSDSKEFLTEKIAELKEIAARVGRPFESIEITMNWRLGTHPKLPEYEALGVSRALVLLSTSGKPDPRKAIDLIASRFV